MCISKSADSEKKAADPYVVYLTLGNAYSIPEAAKSSTQFRWDILKVTLDGGESGDFDAPPPRLVSVEVMPRDDA